MSAERINGIKLNLETMTDQELGNLLDTRVQAMQAAEKDVTRVLDVMEQRGMITGLPDGVIQDRLLEI
jgi:hypothetical protein